MKKRIYLKIKYEQNKIIKKKNKKCLNKVEKFCQQIRKDPFFHLCVIGAFISAVPDYTLLYKQRLFLNSVSVLLNFIMN